MKKKEFTKIRSIKRGMQVSTPLCAMLLLSAINLSPTVAGTSPLSAAEADIIGIPAQQRTLSGKVTGPDGTPLVGVTVSIVDFSISTQTDRNGEYDFRIPQEAKTVRFTFVGFKEVEQPLQNKTSIDVQLEEASDDLEEVVVVGYGTQKKIQTLDRKSTRLNSSHVKISYAVFCLKKKKKK